MPATKRNFVFFDYFRAPTLDNAQTLDAGRVAAKAGDAIDVLRNELVAAKQRRSELTEIPETRLPRCVDR